MKDRRKYGVIGRHISHSLSPELHGIFARYTRPYDYERLDLEEHELEGVIRNTEYSGFNVTSPYKRTVIPFLDELTPEAEALQAVNTIRRLSNGRLVGHNTDVYGFEKLAKEKRIRGRKVLVLGTGGASSAICQALRNLGAKEIIRVSRNRRPEPDCCTYDELNRHPDAQVIVNSTPIGMYPNNGHSPLDGCSVKWTDFQQLETALDAIYNPYRTKFLMDAEEAGAEVESGLAMLVYQGLRSAQIWGEVPRSGKGRRIVAEQTRGENGRKKEKKKRSIPVDLGREAMKSLLRKQLNITVIGMPGSGKSSISRQVAIRTGRTFVDLDREINKIYGMTSEEMIRQYGEDYFRERESATLKKYCRGNGMVISTGGGIVVREENWPVLRENSLVVYLDRPLHQLAKKDRPMTAALGVEELYRQRGWKYEKVANLVISNNREFGLREKEKKKANAKIRNQNYYMEDIRRFADQVKRRVAKHINESVNR